MAYVPTTNRQYYDTQGKENSLKAFSSALSQPLAQLGNTIDEIQQVKITAQLSEAKQQIKMKEMELRNKYESNPYDQNYQKDFDAFTKGVYGQLRQDINPIYRNVFDRATAELNKSLQRNNEEWQFKQTGVNLSHDIEKIADNLMDDAYENGTNFDYQSAISGFDANMNPVIEASRKYLGAEKTDEALQDIREKFLFNFATGAMDTDINQAESLIKSENFRNEVGGSNYNRLIRAIDQKKKQMQKQAQAEARKQLIKSQKARKQAIDNAEKEKEKEFKRNFFEMVGKAPDKDDLAYAQYHNYEFSQEEYNLKEKQGHYRTTGERLYKKIKGKELLTNNDIDDLFQDEMEEPITSNQRKRNEHLLKNGVFEDLEVEQIKDVLREDFQMQKETGRFMSPEEIQDFIQDGIEPAELFDAQNKRAIAEFEKREQLQTEQEKAIADEQLQQAQSDFRALTGEELRGWALTHHKLFNEIPTGAVYDIEKQLGRSLTQKEYEQWKADGTLPTVPVKATRAESAPTAEEIYTKILDFEPNAENIKYVHDMTLGGYITPSQGFSELQMLYTKATGKPADENTKTFMKTYYTLPLEEEMFYMQETGDIPDNDTHGWYLAGGYGIANKAQVLAWKATGDVFPSAEDIAKVTRFLNKQEANKLIEQSPTIGNEEEARNFASNLVLGIDLNNIDDMQLAVVAGQLDKLKKSNQGPLPDEEVEEYMEPIFNAEVDRDYKDGIDTVKRVSDEVSSEIFVNRMGTKRSSDNFEGSLRMIDDAKKQALYIENRRRIYVAKSLKDPKNELAYRQEFYIEKNTHLFPQLRDDNGNLLKKGDKLTLYGVEYELKSNVNDRDIYLSIVQ